LSGKAGIEVPENEGRKKLDAEKSKARVTKEMLTVRRVYDRYAQDIPRASVIIRTTNEERFLHLDASGYRRFPVLECPMMVNKPWEVMNKPPEDYWVDKDGNKHKDRNGKSGDLTLLELIWAEVASIVFDDLDAHRLSKAEIKFINMVARRYVDYNELENDARLRIEHTLVQEGESLTISRGWSNKHQVVHPCVMDVTEYEAVPLSWVFDMKDKLLGSTTDKSKPYNLDNFKALLFAHGWKPISEPMSITYESGITEKRQVIGVPRRVMKQLGV